jgi:trans-aconitate 2-methyltransferase
MTWNPQQYLKFGSERLRPAADLLARVPLVAPRTIVDLGCGAGNVTALLRARWPGADIVGVDNSAQMLERARSALPGVTWRSADLAQWAPPAPVDLLFSNAALQWLDHHATLFPRLAGHLEPEGVLAVQMPAQHDAPSHRIGYGLAQSPRWRDRLQPLIRAHAVQPPEFYYSVLRPHVSSLDLWSTEYVQALSGDDPVVEFTKGSFVGAWLSALAPDEARDFEAEYRAAVAQAYPQRDDGVTLFPFRRLFLVAQR